MLLFQINNSSNFSGYNRVFKNSTEVSWLMEQSNVFKPAFLPKSRLVSWLLKGQCNISKLIFLLTSKLVSWLLPQNKHFRLIKSVKSKVPSNF
jgi:hypothetical protein